MPEIFDRRHAQLLLEKLRQRVMVHRRGFADAIERDILLEIALDEDYSSPQMRLGYAHQRRRGVFLLEHAVSPLEHQDDLHEAGPAAAGPVPVRLLAQLGIQAREQRHEVIQIIFEDRENEAFFVGEWLEQEHVVAQREAAVIAAAQALEGHVDVQEHRVEIDRVTFQPLLFRQLRVLAFVEADEAGRRRLEGGVAHLEVGAPFAHDDKQEAMPLDIEILERVVFYAAHLRDSADVVFAADGLRYHTFSPRNRFVLL